MTDEELYMRFAQGHNDALDELLVRYKTDLTLFLYALVGDMDDAEDLMMDSFALILSKRNGFLGKSSFKSWLYGIGRNLARNHLRKCSAVPAGDELEFLAGIGDPEAAQPLLEKERNQKLYAAMHELPADYMTVLYLLFFEDMSIREISSVMKKSDKQVYNLIARAKTGLRTILKDSEDLDELLSF